MFRNDTESKSKILKDYIEADFVVGEECELLESAIESYVLKPNRTISVVVKSVLPDGLYKVGFERYNKPEVLIVEKKSLVKNTYNIGVDPFPKQRINVKTINFQLESIIFNILDRDRTEKYEIVKGVKIRETNWNPYVVIDGEKKYYQRDFCWTLEQKQNLIDSIYNDIECGKIIIRERDWHSVEKAVLAGDTEVCFKDIVDGKQRLKTIIDFANNEFADSNGVFYGDMSERAQRKFTNSQLFSYCSIEGVVDDRDILKQFLKTNFTGVPQSKEHIEYVKSLLKSGE